MINFFFFILGIWVSNKTFKTEFYKYVLKTMQNNKTTVKKRMKYI